MVTAGRLGLRRLMAADALVGVAVVLLAVFRTPDGGMLGWALAALLGLPLAVRRSRPAPVLVVVVAAAMAAITVGIADDAVVLAIAFALYPVGLTAPPRPGAMALVGSLAGVAGGGLAVLAVPGLPLVAAPDGAESFATAPVPVLLYSATIIAGSWALARAVRARRAHAAQLAELRARQAVADERLRIARDIHDVVGHSLSLIAMQAAVANHLGDSRPAEGRAALVAIEQVSRGALDDVRTVLGALRDPAGSAPGAAELDRLVADTSTAGATVEIDRNDLARAPAALQVSAYRIVQEALTNVLRHASPARCRLTIVLEPAALRIHVVDEGTARRPVGPAGHGLLGMRERVAVHGGTLEAGAEPGGGYAVRARLPLRPGGAP